MIAYNTKLKCYLMGTTQLRNMWYGMGDAQCNSSRSRGEKFEFSPIAFTLLTDKYVQSVQKLNIY